MERPRRSPTKSETSTHRTYSVRLSTRQKTADKLLTKIAKAALVIADRPDVHGFQTDEVTADFTFVRFHAGTRGRNGNYSRSELDSWAERLARRSYEIDVYAYFNNDWEGYAVRNALYLRRRLLQERHSEDCRFDAPQTG